MHYNVMDDQKKILKNLKSIEGALNTSGDLILSDFSSNDTLIVLVDVINGFVGEGIYGNPMAMGIIPTVGRLLDCGIPCIAFADAHTEESLEFEAHPVHALSSSTESDLLDIVQSKVVRVFNKDSINGFFAEGFKSFFDDKKEIKRIIVAGLVTDICVLNFCLTLKSYCNQIGRKIGIHVPMSGVESFELETIHSVTLFNLVSGQMMMSNGIKLYTGIK